MKVKHFYLQDGYKIVYGITNPTPDPRATERSIAPLVNKKITDEEYKDIYMKNIKYSEEPGTEFISDEISLTFIEKLEQLEEAKYKLITDSMKIIPNDYVGTEYWTKNPDGKWKKEKIEKTGIALPAGHKLQEALTADDSKEISAQLEAERIASLEPGKREEEKQFKIKALAREINQKAADAELMGEVYDKAADFQSRKADIEVKYSA